jgi:hypothetical protein
LGKFKHPGPLGLPDKGNLDTMDELVAENYVDHNPPPFPRLAEGREGLKQSFKIFWKATPLDRTSCKMEVNGDHLQALDRDSR